MHAQHCSAAATARQCSSSRPADAVQQRQRQARQQRSSGVDRVPARAYQRLHWEINRQDDRSIGMKKKERKYKQPAEIASSAATARLDCADCTAAVSSSCPFSQLSSNERARLSADSNNHRHCTQAKVLCGAGISKVAVPVAVEGLDSRSHDLVLRRDLHLLAQLMNNLNRATRFAQLPALPIFCHHPAKSSGTPNFSNTSLNVAPDSLNVLALMTS